MPASSGQLAPPALQDLLTDGTLAGSWVLDPRASSVRLKAKVVGLITVNGGFSEVTGAGTVQPDGTARGRLTVGTASIDTRNTRRDVHLRSADFFDSDNSPDIIFAASGVRPKGQGVVVTGALTIRGQTRPLSVETTVSVRGDGEIGLDAVVQVNRADFGITWNALGLTSMNATVTIRATFVRG
jgi:polyisoprenoid-binding protein YceI